MRRRRLRPIPRTASPLSLFTLQRHYDAARRAVTKPGGYQPEPFTTDGITMKHNVLRRVQAEFHRRLAKAGIHVEGM